jgi:renalase
VVAVPPAQAAPLLAPGAPELGSRVEGADMLPCWAGLIELAPAAEEGTDELPWDAAWLDHPVLAWVARDGSKPGRPSRDSWVLHASPEWSRANIEAEVSDAAEALATAFREVTGRSVDPSSVRMHRWRYALPAEAMGERALWDAGHGLGFCGDACLGGRVEGAFLSGVALAGRILAPGAQGADPPPSQKAAQGELFGRRV